MVARFLNWYPQYRLEDLRRMPPGEFLYLLSGMLDVVAPHATEPATERVSRLMREAHEKAMATARKGRRRRRRW